MKKILQLSLVFLLILTLTACKENSRSAPKIAQSVKASPPEFALVIHGGAGYIKNLPPEAEKAYKEKMEEALHAGYIILENGGNAIDAVEKTINIMENSPLFNAGKGAVLNNLGQVEMDASIMDGKSLNAGAVAGVHHIKNPISAARIVMDSSKHVLLCGEGAEQYLKHFGLEMKDNEYFIIEKRKKQLKKIQGKKTAQTDYTWPKSQAIIDDHKYGTVGCVALDKKGNIAAGTSTGGLMNKKYGRIGDSPIIGAGTYANNATCGISCTGTGEYFIRTMAAHEASELMRYKNYSLKEAQKSAINQVEELGGDGGMIGLDKKGNISWYFNTEGMFRGYQKSGEKAVIKFYKE
jgi:beta-aspartyl-peptidase (threonine type)